MRAITITKRKELIKASNKNCFFEIDKKTGMVSSFSLFNSKQAQWDDIVENKLIYKNRAGLLVKDELSGKQYADPFGCSLVYYHEPRKLVNLGQGTDPSCGKIRIEGSKEYKKIIFTKTYKNAPFVLKNDIFIYKDFIQWDLVFKLKPGNKNRSIKVEYAFPIFRSVNGGYFPKGWKTWVPLQEAPFDFGHTGGWGHTQASWYIHHFPYCSVNAGAGIGLPLMDIFNEIHDFGLSIAAPLDLLKPEIVFIIDKENSQLKLTYGNIGLRSNKEYRVSLMLFPHKGDWRQALGWFHKKYKKYFEPNNKKIITQEGTMFYGVPTVPERTIKSWVEHMGLKWTEVLYTPIYGDYVPKRPIWDFDMLMTPEHPERVIRNLNKDKIRKYLSILKRHGVASFVYFNYGDCDKEIALKNFPESIIWDADGMRGGWVFPDKKRMNLLMNPEPDSRWGKYMLGQVEEIFDTYEDMDGLFIDQLCYHAYDYSKDDGRTMVDNRIVSDTHGASLRMMGKIAAILKRRNKTCFANGPYNVEIMKDVDGIMSEGSLGGLAKYSYLCLAKPVMVLTYNVFGTHFEKVLKCCLKYGAFPSTPWHHKDTFNPNPLAKPPRETLMLYKRYLPLIEKLRGRRWVLSSNPVSFPPGLDGNIFQRRGGGYVLPFYVQDALLSNKFWNTKNPRTITVRLPNKYKVPKATWLSVNLKQKTLPVRHSQDGLIIDIPEYTDASVLLF